MAPDATGARNPAPATFDSAHFRRVLGQFPTGLVVVTGMDSQEPVGMAVGSFTSVSLAPPMVGFLPDKSSTSWPRIRRAGSFVVNVLGENQENVCRAFAASGGDKFSGIGWRRGPGGAPILDGITAWISCDIADVVDAGDHWFVLGAVRDLAATSGGNPLLFFRGRYAHLEEKSRSMSLT
ncbi:flavin reductase family protein [Streptomyces sp. SP17BM10]|uniref:flavin reductase family protein n=1 Tax=Streptomyces sp. SP17BM10 TaxID=3002530 RepID=UPI002E762B5D|nr:flavin reductase family protein [Streptomyces sp. SP17BM10]MEE1784161.1 flavin reductase family protein [Streptomyces sp. SP17BM10]